MSRNRKKSRKPEPRKSAAERQSEQLSRAADLAIDAQTVAFVRWYELGENNLGEDAMAILDSVKRFAWLHAANGGLVSATAFDPETFFLSVSQMQEVAERDESNFFAILMDDVKVYIAFLDDAGLWTGLPEDLDEIVSSFELEDDAEDLPAEPTTAPQSSEEPSDPAIAWTQELLQWIAPGKDVTAKGALRLADIQPAAATVGLFALGSQKKMDDAELADFADEQGTLPQVVRSMTELPRLAAVWNAALAAGLLELGSKKVNVSEAGAEFSAAHPSAPAVATSIAESLNA